MIKFASNDSQGDAAMRGVRFVFPRTIRNRFILIAVTVSFVPLMIISIYSTYTYTNATKKYVTNAMEDLQNSIDTNLNIMFGDVKDMVNIVSTMDVVQNISNETDPSKWDLMRLMGNFTINKKYINTILISNRHTMYYLTKNSGKMDSVNLITYTYRQDFFQSVDDWFSDIQRHNTMGQWLDGSKIPLGSNAILYGQAFKNMNTMDYIGMIVIGIDRNIFESLKSNMNTSEYHIVILNQEALLYSSLPELGPESETTVPFINRINSSPGSSVDTIQVNDGDYMYSVKINELTGWKIVCLVNKSALISKNYSVTAITVAMIVLSLFFSVGFIILSSDKITRQIQLLTLAIEKFGKMEDIDFTFDENDEVGRIGAEFQRVVRENKALTSNLYNAIIKQKESELMALQSQINPHFLYNTLNSIYLMAEKIQAQNISMMVMNLSKIFKFALNRGDSFTIVKNEIKHVECYLEIQKVRYGDKINVHIEIEEEMLYKKMIKFILQPLVENAIYHGLEPKEENGNLYISGYLRDNRMIFVIRDDGIGFDSEVVLSDGRGIGIRNVDERIKLYYGSDYGLQIESKIGVGTQITITLENMN
jgi:two-component system sensor histidine kinase YesM